jgi:hypothetical protein
MEFDEQLGLMNFSAMSKNSSERKVVSYLH